MGSGEIVKQAIAGAGSHRLSPSNRKQGDRERINACEYEWQGHAQFHAREEIPFAASAWYFEFMVPSPVPVRVPGVE